MSNLDRELDRLARNVPTWAAPVVRCVRKPGSGWIRYPLALVLIGGGIVGFLPILGFWMIPLGLVLIAEDVPFLQRPLGGVIRWINDRLEGPNGTRAAAQPDDRTH
jgi:hypothetical protein